MLNLDRILQNDRLLRAMTGLNRKAFEELLPVVRQIIVGLIQQNLTVDIEPSALKGY